MTSVHNVACITPICGIKQTLSNVRKFETCNFVHLFGRAQLLEVIPLAFRFPNSWIVRWRARARGSVEEHLSARTIDFPQISTLFATGPQRHENAKSPPGETRTHTESILSRLPLPIGLQGDHRYEAARVKQYRTVGAK